MSASPHTRVIGTSGVINCAGCAVHLLIKIVDGLMMLIFSVKTIADSDVSCNECLLRITAHAQLPSIFDWSVDFF